MKEHCLLEKTMAFAIIISFYLSVTEFFTFDEGIELLYRIYTWKFKFSCFFVMQINDRYEFPLQLDLDRDDGKYLSPDADRNVRNLYTLHR